jgi:hypothetical protein
MLAATLHYPWASLLVLILILLAFSIARVSRRPRPIDRSLAVHACSDSGIAKLTCDVECKEQDRLSDHKRNRESNAGEPAYEQRALL